MAAVCAAAEKRGIKNSPDVHRQHRSARPGQPHLAVQRTQGAARASTARVGAVRTGEGRGCGGPLAVPAQAPGPQGGHAGYGAPSHRPAPKHRVRGQRRASLAGGDSTGSGLVPRACCRGGRSDRQRWHRWAGPPIACRCWCRSPPRGCWRWRHAPKPAWALPRPTGSPGWRSRGSGQSEGGSRTWGRGRQHGVPGRSAGQAPHRTACSLKLRIRVVTGVAVFTIR